MKRFLLLVAASLLLAGCMSYEEDNGPVGRRRFAIGCPAAKPCAPARDPRLEGVK